MKDIAVVTPFKDESAEAIRQCIDSVTQQTLRPRMHIFICDGGKLPLKEDALPPHVYVITLPRGCEDTGATPRAIGSIYATRFGCTGILYLDSDNTWAEDHIETVVKTATEQQAQVVISDRWICHHTTYEPLFLDKTENAETVVDTNTLGLFGPAIMAGTQWWNIPKTKGRRTAGVDRYLWHLILQHKKKHGWRIARTNKATSFYRSRWTDHYMSRLDIDPPNPAKLLRVVNGVAVADWVVPTGEIANGKWLFRPRDQQLSETKPRETPASKIPPEAYLLIIGAMKSGTSSLFHYLAQHPNICAANIKEPEYFSEHQGHTLSVKTYESIWNFDTRTHRYAMEASTGYTKYPTEKNVPVNISKAGLKPKFIYIVRNPFDRIVSHYNFMKKKSGWNLQIDDPSLIQTSNYFLQLRQYLNVFPRESILVIDLDELKRDLNKTLSECCEFLGLPAYQFREIPPLNKNLDAEKKQLSNQQIEHIHATLKTDMVEFGDLFGVDIKNWGF